MFSTRTPHVLSVGIFFAKRSRKLPGLVLSTPFKKLLGSSANQLMLQRLRERRFSKQPYGAILAGESLAVL